MSDCVWVTNALTGTEYVYHFRTDALVEISSGGPQRRELLDRLGRLESFYLKAGPILDSDLLSDEAVLGRIVNKINPLPHFMSNGLSFISDDLRALLEGFELGQTAFKQLTLVNPFAKTRHPNYNWLNIRETKDCVVVDASAGLRERPVAGTHTFSIVDDDLIVVRRDALAGVDLWLESDAFRRNVRQRPALQGVEGIGAGEEDEVRALRYRVRFTGER